MVRENNPSQEISSWRNACTPRNAFLTHTPFNVISSRVIDYILVIAGTSLTFQRAPLFNRLVTLEPVWLK